MDCKLKLRPHRRKLNHGLWQCIEHANNTEACWAGGQGVPRPTLAARVLWTSFRHRSPRTTPPEAESDEKTVNVSLGTTRAWGTRRARDSQGRRGIIQAPASVPLDQVLLGAWGCHWTARWRSQAETLHCGKDTRNTGAWEWNIRYVCRRGVRSQLRSLGSVFEVIFGSLDVDLLLVSLSRPALPAPRPRRSCEFDTGASCTKRRAGELTRPDIGGRAVDLGSQQQLCCADPAHVWSSRPSIIY